MLFNMLSTPYLIQSMQPFVAPLMSDMVQLNGPADCFLVFKLSCFLLNAFKRLTTVWKFSRHYYCFHWTKSLPVSRQFCSLDETIFVVFLKDTLTSVSVTCRYIDRQHLSINRVILEYDSLRLYINVDRHRSQSYIFLY